MFEFLRSITAPSFIKTGGTSAQFLKADGSVDSSAYAKYQTTTGNVLTVSDNITGSASACAIRVESEVQNDVSQVAFSFLSAPKVKAGHALPNLYHFVSALGTLNVGASIGAQFSFIAESSAIGANYNYGFYGNLAAGTGTYNFFAGGTADNYFKGTTKIGLNTSVVFDTSAAFETLKVNSDSSLKLGRALINSSGLISSDFYGLPGDTWLKVQEWYSSNVADSYRFTLHYQWKTTSGIDYRLSNTIANTINCFVEFGDYVYGLRFGTSDLTRAYIDTSGNFIVGTAALSTSATAGFLWIPSCPGVPTSAPTAPYTNASALITDTTNNNFVHRSGSTWITNTKLTGEGSALGWKDIIGVYVPHASGAPAPAFTQVGTGFFYAYAFAVDDVAYYTFHINHDYAPGTNIFLHAHFMCSGTNTNSILWEFTYSFAKGHNQSTDGNFNATGTTVSKTYAMTTTAQYRHHIAEIDAGILGATLEVDGLLIVRVARRTNGGTNNTDTCWMLCADVHYQMDRSATKNKAPSFYV